MSTTRLEREASPPSGKTASPIPQYRNETTAEYEAVEGKSGHAYYGALTGMIVDLKNLLDNFGEVQASPTANTLLERVKVIKTELDVIQTQLGDTTDVVVAAGAAGSLSAKLRRLTTDLAALLALDFASETTLAAIEVLQTSIDGTLTAIAALNFAEQTTLLALQTAFDAKVAMETYGNGVPGAHTGEVVGALYLDVTNGDIYASTGAAWVLKVEDIWD